MTETKRKQFKTITKEMMEAQYEHHKAYMADPMREQRFLDYRLRREAEIDEILNPPRGWLTRALFG